MEPGANKATACNDHQTEGASARVVLRGARPVSTCQQCKRVTQSVMLQLRNPSRMLQPSSDQRQGNSKVLRCERGCRSPHPPPALPNASFSQPKTLTTATPHLASLKTRKTRNVLSAESPPAVLPEPPNTVGGERINSNAPTTTIKPSNKLNLSLAYPAGPSAMS